MDEADATCERQEIIDSMARRNATLAAAAIPTGHSGECVKCGGDSERLMEAAFFAKNNRRTVAAEIESAMESDPNTSGVCPPCRDKYHLP